MESFARETRQSSYQSSAAAITLALRRKTHGLDRRRIVEQTYSKITSAYDEFCFPGAQHSGRGQKSGRNFIYLPETIFFGCGPMSILRRPNGRWPVKPSDGRHATFPFSRPRCCIEIKSVAGIISSHLSSLTCLSTDAKLSELFLPLTSSHFLSFSTRASNLCSLGHRSSCALLI